ncbi:hypothetical protein BG015_007828 [Linnemannia schmuckeri]|uniref:AMP-activated protein kinase glycogen-binding domain-containing protein n=1 Tax=Linnemannia schmuckeri TaxID=64567 RepID=A0A9P5VAT4_9FUNG|nr:hypothetical protein BG015_007828 [Linnemannia schmuckeri]
MPATPKAAIIGNGQKIAASSTAAASPVGSVRKPSPSSAGMSTSVEASSTPLSKNQKKKNSKAVKADPATATSPTVASVAAVNGSVPSTPVANVKQQETSTSTKQQITPIVESLGLSEEKNMLAKDASPIARNILDAASVPTKKETVAQSKPADLPQPSKRALVAHTFQWKNGGDVVKVTGTFDNWEESIVLEKIRGNLDQSEIVVDLDRTQKTLFKFIVDGQWKCTDEFLTEYDSNGNLNNVLPALNA